MVSFPYFNRTAVPYTFVSVNRRYNEARATVPLKCGKRAANIRGYTDIFTVYSGASCNRNG